MSKGDIRYCADTMIMETLLRDSSMTKSAQSGILSGAASMIGEYASSHMNPDDKVGSVINMLAPVGIFKLFSLFGHGTLGILLGVVASALHIDVGSMVESLFESVKDTLQKGQKVSPAQIDSAVSQTIQQHTPQDDQSPADTMTNSIAQDLREARMVRLAIEQYNYRMLRLIKEDSPVLFSYAAGRAARTTSLIGRLLGWIFKTILLSAGFLVAGDEAAKLMGMPNALDKTWHAGQPSSTTPSVASVPAPVTTQTKFKPTGTGTDAASQPWEEHTSNDPGSIENMLIDFTKQVYSGLDGHEDWIRSSPTFQAVKNQIVWYNHTAAGEPMVYIPINYPNKKTIVDHYIDEVVKAAV